MAQLKKPECPWNQWQKGEERIEYAEECPGDGEYIQLVDELICSLITLLLCQKEAFDAGVPEKLSS